jgi:hypothetical protein
MVTVDLKCQAFPIAFTGQGEFINKDLNEFIIGVSETMDEGLGV